MLINRRFKYLSLLHQRISFLAKTSEYLSHNPITMSQSHTFTVFSGSESGAITKGQTTRPALQNDDVYVKITCSGLCGTDEHFRKQCMVLGHEGVGIVEELGPSTHHLKVGDRVGWGFGHDSCGFCGECLRGNEIHCPERKMFGNCNLDQGSFGHGGVWREAFLFKLPDEISDADAAPLMCGGVTVFAALHDHGAKSTDRVGVIGIGGLGHLAIQFAAKMGCAVTVFSSTESKREEAMQLGATDFVVTKGATAEDLKTVKPINQLLVTASFTPDWKLLLPLMAPKGVVYPLTVAGGNLDMPYLDILWAGLRIQGSLVGSRFAQLEMLRFAAHHGIKPIVQKFPMTVEGIEDAMTKLNEGKIRYRAVLVPQGE